jgi:hypothetical protein
LAVGLPIGLLASAGAIGGVGLGVVAFVLILKKYVLTTGTAVGKKPGPTPVLTRHDFTTVEMGDIGAEMI